MGLGALFKNESVGLLEDLPEIGEETAKGTWDQQVVRIKELYSGNAWNCWIAGAAYFVVFVGSVARIVVCLR